LLVIDLHVHASIFNFQNNNLLPSLIDAPQRLWLSKSFTKNNLCLIQTKSNKIKQNQTKSNKIKQNQTKFIFGEAFGIQNERLRVHFEC
jgi:hypothetical protein